MSIRLKNHWFCSLHQNLDSPNFPKNILSTVHLVIQAQFPRNCSWVNLSNSHSKAFNLWQIIWLANSRIRSLHRNPTGPNSQKSAIGQTLSPYWNLHSSVTTDLISYFIVSIPICLFLIENSSKESLIFSSSSWLLMDQKCQKKLVVLIYLDIPTHASPALHSRFHQGVHR